MCLRYVTCQCAQTEPGTCSNGLAGYQDKSVCCKEACGMCGGAGCGNVNGTAGPSDCCPTQILAANQTCGGKVVAPCIIAGESCIGVVRCGAFGPRFTRGIGVSRHCVVVSRIFMLPPDDRLVCAMRNCLLRLNASLSLSLSLLAILLSQLTYRCRLGIPGHDEIPP